MQQDLEQRTRSTVALLVSYGLQGKDLVNVLVQAPRVLAQTLPQLTTRIAFAARHLGANLQVCGTRPSSCGIKACGDPELEPVRATASLCGFVVLDADVLALMPLNAAAVQLWQTLSHTRQSSSLK